MLESLLLFHVTDLGNDKSILGTHSEKVTRVCCFISEVKCAARTSVKKKRRKSILKAEFG